MPIEGRFVYGDDYYVPEEYMDEQWEQVREPFDYMVSDKGRVWSIKTEQFIKPKKADKHGHLGICMSRDGVTKYSYIHRLMAEAFELDRRADDTIVRHLDDDPTNNVLDNLAWGTQKDNMRDCLENGHFYSFTEEDRQKRLSMCEMRVKAIEEKTGKVTYYKSQSEAGRQLDIPQANIFKVIKGERPRAKGYIFRKAED